MSDTESGGSEERFDRELISDLARIVRILNRQVKRGGPADIEEVCGQYMDPELTALYLDTILLDSSESERNA